ncbi:MAG: hypothetical protein ACQ5SW_00930 [Sphaerochaetaceae bacterium]
MNIAQSKRLALPICLEVEALPRSGNNVPNAWYQHLKHDGGKKEPKANFAAIAILSEIVWWYRPTEQRDELTGQSLPPTRKFKGDKLQMSYAALAQKFGMSKRQATNACKYLSDKGLITLEFRTLKLPDGRKLNNVLYVEPIPSEISKISSVPDSKEATPITFESDTLSLSKVIPPTNKSETNTENTNIDINQRDHHTHTEQTANAGVCVDGVNTHLDKSANGVETPKPKSTPPENHAQRIVDHANNAGWSIKVTKSLAKACEGKSWDELKQAMFAMCEQHESEDGLKHQQRYFTRAVEEGWDASEDWYNLEQARHQARMEQQCRERDRARVRDAVDQLNNAGEIILIEWNDGRYSYRFPEEDMVYVVEQWRLPKGYGWKDEAA